MNDRQLRHLLGYIAVVRESLRMQNWDILLHREPVQDADTWATTWQHSNHSTINIRISPDLLNQPPASIRNAVVHELVHAQHRDVTELWEGCTLKNSDVPLSQSQSWDHDFHIFIERFVAWVTQRIEGSVPLYDPNKRYRPGEGCYINGEQPC